MPDVAQLTRDQFREYVMGRPATYWREGVAIHHTVMEQFGYEGAVAVMNYHLSIGWRDCGYHVIIDPDGTLYLYRMRPMEDSGAHIGDPWNQSHVGVSLQGNYSVRYPTAEMADTLKFVIATIGERYGTGNAYIFHRDVDATACPGYNLTHELIDQWLGGNTGYQPPTQPPVATTPPDLSFPTKPKVPFPPFNFIQGSGECLGVGDEALEVRDLELCLYYLGYIAYQPNTLLFDAYTETGVKAFQANYVPPADGIYGVKTATILQWEVDRKWSGMPPVVVPTPPPAEPPVIIEPPAPPAPEPPVPNWFIALIERFIEWLKAEIKILRGG